MKGFIAPRGVGAPLEELFIEPNNIQNLSNGHLASGSHIIERQLIGLHITSPNTILPDKFEKHLVIFDLSGVWENPKQLVNASSEFSALLRLLGINFPVTSVL